MYLTIITTVLVITQAIRLIQNAIQLRGMKNEFEYKKAEYDLRIEALTEFVENLKEQDEVHIKLLELLEEIKDENRN